MTDWEDKKEDECKEGAHLNTLALNTKIFIFFVSEVNFLVLLVLVFSPDWNPLIQIIFLSLYCFGTFSLALNFLPFKTKPDP